MKFYFYLASSSLGLLAAFFICMELCSHLSHFKHFDFICRSEAGVLVFCLVEMFGGITLAVQFKKKTKPAGSCFM